MKLFDGKKLSEKILLGLKEGVVHLGKKPRLAIVVVGEHAAARKFIEQKNKAAESIGVEIKICPFEESIATNALRKRLAEIVHNKKNSGIIVQLPLPEQINTQYILNAVPPEKDVDVLSARALGNFFVGKPPHQNFGGGGRSDVLPPVVGAVKALFDEYGIEYRGKNIVVVGAGRLVGKPAALWLINEGATISVVNEHTKDISEFTKKADIIISGVGKPGLIKGDMIKNGAVIIDAGTSELGGKVVGDVDFDSVAKKASYITPVPGGVGPLTVAMLFKNLTILAEHAN